MDNVRAVALSVLNKCVSAEQYSNLALDTAIERNDLKPADRGLLTVLVYGVLEKQFEIYYSMAERKESETAALCKSSMAAICLCSRADCCQDCGIGAQAGVVLGF